MKLRESPRDRLKAVTLGLLAHKSGPNVVAGIALGALLQALAGMSPWWWPLLTGSVWVTWILVYAVADEVQAQLEEKKNRLLSPESEFYGIE